VEFVEQERRFQEWVESHRGIIIKVTRSFSRETDDFEDLFQEILLQIWKSIPAFKQQSQSSTWIYRVALNRAMIWKRKEFKRRDILHALHAEKRLFFPQDQRQSERIEILYAAIRKLRKADRALILLALDGLSYREIAQITDITESNVGARLSRTKKKLSELVKGGVYEFR